MNITLYKTKYFILILFFLMSIDMLAQTEENSYVENSMLASGKWYKFAISSTGIHKLTYSDIHEAMGQNAASIDPRNIRIFHNGGGTLPLINNETRHQDLVEIPIYVHGESDGMFNENDYIVFYARGPVTWSYKNQAYERNLNPYSDYSYIFLTADSGEGKRIQNEDEVLGDADVAVTSFLDYRHVEEDTYNLNNMGATWYFNKFDATTTSSFSFNFPNLIKDRNCILKSESASRNTASSASLRYKANGSLISTVNFSKISDNGTYAREGNTGDVTFNSANDQITISLEYVKSATSSEAWLDYITINAWRELRLSGDMMRFSNPECDDVTKVYRYELKNAPSSLQIWNVTNPVEPKIMPLKINSNVASFYVKGDVDNEFIAFNGNGFYSADFVSYVNNQNLHSVYDFDYLIIVHPDFYSQAERLKELHAYYDNLSIEIVTPQKIYNEFSCGALDVTAIRDYIKMVYDKSDERLKYVLLFGDASYDFRNKSGNVCLIPSYQSEHSVSHHSNVIDDFYACMDAAEGDMSESNNRVDIAVGRFPVNTLEEAVTVVDKVETYMSKDEECMGTWRKHITFVADDDNNTFANHAEQLEEIIRENIGDDIIVDKIYLDAYPQVATSSGQRSPECNAAITNRIELGTSIVNYIGHAGEVGWADERILMNEDIHALRNSPKLHLMTTASCEFSRFDDHTRTSAGEYVFLNKYGGAIAMVTAARVTYGSNNQNLFRRFYERMFDMEDGEYPTMGELYVHAKQIGDENSRDYHFFGDPALRLNFPTNKIELTSVNGHDVNATDTIRALQSANIKGVLKDTDGALITDFHGVLHINIYDKEKHYNTLADESSGPINFKLRNSVIYSGKVPVVNGEFEAGFTLPKDINYSYGNGLMSFYAYSETAEAQGSFDNFIVGGMNENADTDYEGPEIEIHIDDVRFVDGSMTNENPLLIAYLKDENGINTSGAGIGHDITATLVGATNKTYTLNQFYDAPLTMDEFGVLTYKFYNLNEGEHTLTFKAWDIYNNSNSATIRFNVVKGKIIDIENVVNYPNPMSDYTNFTFEHNQKDNEIDVQIRIYDMMGQLVRTIEEHYYGTTARIDPIYWDGTSDRGSKLPPGMYVYYVTITNSQKEQSSGYSKLVIR